MLFLAVVQCPKKICFQYLKILHLNKKYFNTRHDRCYCSKCYGPSKPKGYPVGKPKFTVPIGWVSFGIQVDKAFVSNNQIFKKWYTTFYGTSKDKLDDIIHNRFIPFPGDDLLSGKKFVLNLSDQHHIYTSPSINYASLDHAVTVVTIQPSQHNNSKTIDPLAKIRPIISKKPHLVQSLVPSKTIQISSGFKIPNTRIQSTDNDTSYLPLVTISDNEHSDEDDFVLPVQKLTKEELREELKVFQSTNSISHALLANDNDDNDIDELQFRTQQPFNRSVCCYQYPFSFKNSSYKYSLFLLLYLFIQINKFIAIYFRLMSDSKSLIDIVKHEQGHFDAENILFLDLNSRNLTDANSLSICRNLIILNLNNNNLTNVRGFGTLTQLQKLSLAQNQINSLDGLQSCENLEILNVAGNNLTGLKSLAPLLYLTHLRSLCLNDRQNNLTNPLCNSSSYQKDVKNNLPNLDTLDNEWLGQGFQEHLSSLESAIEQLETLNGNSKPMTNEKPTIIITQATSSDRSIYIANEEYDELFQSIQMLVK
ncbi:unnamed protein product [Rotaria sp. Silwood1]|nr:unnamed protein product [Rotaria sp. Silwood1]CAF4766496.1 unnamed protein product [Rotaria sp. Silwood1]